MANENSAILVIGLGRFGSATAVTLTRLGREVMAIEHNPELVKDWSGKLTHVVEADSTNIDALRQVGAADFQTAVVGIGTSIEASVLTTANLVDLGVAQVWAKAISPAHGKILHRIGAHHVLYPESDAGIRVAHLVSSRMMEYIEFDEGHFAVVKMRPPREIQGFTLAEAKVREKYGVTIVGIKSPGRDFTYAEPTTRVGKQDLLIVAGNVELLSRFAGRP
ncbi:MULTISPECIES: potassium channel family protein [Brevibacterium]|uniref:TrkA family potassium uptake protein n=1 Tax=Brevibacterium casei TaxID=33889 RepID=A0A7T4DJV2_9MICO|nr:MULTISPECIES: TrkA family potassium uptake protein [Brevibacterium]QQB15830.1 TrkA family potassium uptake protein [Brevibacterium casei]